MRSMALISLSCLIACSAYAVTFEPIGFYVWQVDEPVDHYGNWDNPADWADGEVPTTDGTGLVVFPGTFGNDFEASWHSIAVESNVDIASLAFGEQVSYSFYAGQGPVSFRVRDLVDTESGEYYSDIYFGSGITFIGDGDIGFNLGYGVEFEISGPFINGFESILELTGGGTLLLSGDNSHGSLNSTLRIIEGYLGLGHDAAAGDALIEIGDPENPGYNYSGLAPVDGNRVIDNEILVHGYLEVIEDYGNRNELDFAGPVTFTSDSELYNYGGLINFFGGIDEISPGTTLNIWADEPVLLTGPTNLTGGINMRSGIALFTDITALPEVSPGTFLTSSSDETYIGMMIDSSTDRSAATGAFLGLFDRANYTGSIGFDTDPGIGGPANSYSVPIDLTGFAAARIGSVTWAELTGTITPSGDNYLFGGGSGTLMVGSLLEDLILVQPDLSSPPSTITSYHIRGIEAVSTNYDPLTVYINNSGNSFTGTVTAEHSAIIFGDVPGALPTQATLTPGQGGYIGLQDTTRSIASYLAQFDPALNQGIIGFDSQDPQTNRVISDAIDLSGFSATDPAFYLGTSTWVNLGGGFHCPVGRWTTALPASRADP